VQPDSAPPTVANVVATPNPSALNTTVTLTAAVNDSAAGNSAIVSAEYYTGSSGTWTPMTAVDGAFDRPVENVTAGFTARQIGDNSVCVRGTDARGNVSDSVCVTFDIQYVFTGFDPPINNGLPNEKNAGQALELKWRLTDGIGTPISDFAGVVTLYSYSVSCSDFSGDPADLTEEYTTGASGLQYKGDGLWQLSWDTPLTYAGQCRKAYIMFPDGMTSPHVKFKF
jgi:hypothetical protein